MRRSLPLHLLAATLATYLAGTACAVKFEDWALVEEGTGGDVGGEVGGASLLGGADDGGAEARGGEAGSPEVDGKGGFGGEEGGDAGAVSGGAGAGGAGVGIPSGGTSLGGFGTGGAKTGGAATGGIEVGGAATGGNEVTPLGGQSGGGSGGTGEGGAGTTPCGDGVVQPAEECDDGNATGNDGCDARCLWEPGFICTGTAPSYDCHEIICGDNVVEGHESCDDGNRAMGDGCSPTCGPEPICDGGACTSFCGDGLLLGDEQCDDGNGSDGDGCSATCQVEPGYECQAAPPGATMELAAVYRDFKEAHADFEPGATGCDEASPNMVAATLAADGKPTLGSGRSPSPGCNYVSNGATFAEWYRDASGVNATIAATMTLYANGMGGYSNRYGEDGEPYAAAVDTGSERGGYGTDQASCEATCTQRTRDVLLCEEVCAPENELLYATSLELQAEREAPEPDEERIAELEALIEAQEAAAVQCHADCTADFTVREAACQAACLPCSFNPALWCIGGEWVEFDGSPTFFPIDASTFDTARSTASIPDAYGGTWQDDPSGLEHNFWFTSEVRFWFAHVASVDQVLEFTGDDDVWVFVNNRLAVDLGGMHTPLDGSVNLREAAATLGLTDGGVYEIVVFHAERQTTGSSFRLVLSGFAASPSVCSRI